VTRLCPEDQLSNRLLRPDVRRRLSVLALDTALVGAHLFLPRSLTRGLPPIDHLWSGFFSNDPTDRRQKQFVRFIATIGETSKRPTFHYMHVTLPHQPFRLLPSGKQYWTTDLFVAEMDGRRPQDLWHTVQQQQRHLLQLMYVDRLLGETIAALEAEGVYDDAVVVVTADHGVSFRPGVNQRLLQPENVGEILSIPLIIKAPGLEPGLTSDRNAESIDIAPTIAEALGAPLPWKQDGQSLLDLGAPERPYKVTPTPTPLASDGRPPLKLPAQLTARRDVAWKEKLERLGAGHDELHGIGPHRGLLGRELASLEVGDGTTEIVLSDPAQFAAVDLSASHLPVVLEGWIGAGADKQPPLAVAIAGVIRAIGYPAAQDGNFRIMLPEAALASGANLVEVLVVEGDPPGPRLLRPRAGRATQHRRERPGWRRGAHSLARQRARRRRRVRRDPPAPQGRRARLGRGHGAQ
jgi:hypothetical protein